MIYLLTIRDFNEWDENDAKVIRANTEKQARKIANQCVGDEGPIWDNRSRTSCTRIKPTGTAQVILMSFIAG